MLAHDRSETLWVVLHRHGWLTPAVLAAVFTSVAILFGYIHDRRYFGHFGLDVLDYTSHVHFLKAPFRSPAVFLWAVVATFVAGVELWIVMSGKLTGKVKNQLSALLSPFIVLYVVYIDVEQAADSAARTLARVTVELKSPGSGPPQAHQYFLIGRIGNTVLLCDESTGKPIIRESGDLVTVRVDSPDTNTDQACWLSAEH